MNIKYKSKHNHLLYNYYLWATCFDSLESFSGPTRPRDSNYIINGCVLTDILYSYILKKHIGMTNIKNIKLKT